MADLKDFLGRVEAQLKGKKTIAVDMATSKILLAVKTKFQQKYPLFLNTLEAKDIPERASLYKELRTGLRRGSELCGIVLGDKGRPATEEEINELLSTIDGVNQGITGLSRIFEKTKVMKDKLAGVESQTQMSLGEIQRASSVVSQGLKSKSQREGGLINPLKDIGYIGGGALEGTTSLGGKAGVLGGALGLALGPFSPFANYALSAGYSMYQRHKEKKMARQMFGGEVGLMAKQFGVSPGDLQSFRNAKMGGQGLSSKVSNPKGFDINDLMKQYGGTISQGEVGSTPRGPAQEVGGSGKYTTNTAVAAGLNKFFSEMAFKAPYTKKLMEILEGKNGGSGFGGLGGIFSGLGNIFKGLIGGIASIVGKALSGLAGALGLKDIFKKFAGGAKPNGIIQEAEDIASGAAGAGGPKDPYKPKVNIPKTIAMRTKAFLTSAAGSTVIGTAAIGTAAYLAAKLNTAWTDETQSYQKLGDAEDAEAYRQFMIVNNMNRKKKGLAPVGVHAPANQGVNSVSSIMKQSQQLDANNPQHIELVGALKAMADSKKKEGGLTILGGSKDKSSDPFLDYLNSGMLGEEF